MFLPVGSAPKKSHHYLRLPVKSLFSPSICFLVFFLFISIAIIPRTVFAYSQIAEFLCEEGIRDLNRGDLEEAEDEFKRALVAEPGYPPALYYLELMRSVTSDEVTSEAVDNQPVSVNAPVSSAAKLSDSAYRQTVMENALSLNRNRQTLQENEGLSADQVFIPELTHQDQSTGSIIRNKTPLRYLLNDPSLSIQQPIQIQEGKYIILSGSNIKRFLVVQPELLYAEKLNDNEVSVMAKGRGSATIIIWDDFGRTSIECTGILPIPDSPTLEETMRREEERTGNFRLRYNLDWYSYYTGRRLETVKRSGSYSWIHNLRMDGATPYGLLDASITERTLSNTTDMTYVSAGITNGKWGDFKGWNLRAGDYNPYLNNLAMPGADLRGVYFNSPAFNNKLDYTIFWGRENGGRYGTLSMVDYKAQHSFNSGFNLNFTPTTWQNYKFTVVHGWGRDRQSFLRDYAYDLIGNWNFKQQSYSYEIASDTKNLAQTFTSRYNGKQFYANLQFRDIDKEFVNINGSGWRQGEFGALLNFNWRPTDKITYTQRLDVYRDRLYPAEDNPERYNEDADSTLIYKIDPLTSLEVNYTLQNDLGKISQVRYSSAGAGVNRLFSLFGKEISTYAKYSHQYNTNYSATGLDYANEKFYAGLRFSVIGALYYYFNRELNWLTERNTSNYVRPNVTETGLDWYDRIGKSPFWGSMRFTWRDEERANSPLSFLAGEDYIEGYGELSFRPVDGQEVYASARIRNVWKENNTASSRVEASFNVGMKLLWNTGLRWDAVSAIQGYVFKDYNGNGLMERDEPPVFGIKIWQGKKQSQITDELGFFRFAKVKGKMAYITLDTGTLPAGYILTVPVTQEIPIDSSGAAQVYFGITSRSEIRGIVFEDTNEDGEYSVGEKGVSGVAITLDGDKTALTSVDGSYTYAQAQPGDHELSVDLNSIPVYYLPLVPLKKKFPLQEGESSAWNIPLRKIQK
ncbi:MAG TPA: SdrD B-like domain-containing protein [Candidatus Omnitrophota bacterium]|nr:SdrD B-like domain-containing protein [Candidatus Omnitrophota bacterium]HPT39708.1 SdrD B-like domain-containing protein [Candidatus Omnitrophota bacterium]